MDHHPTLVLFLILLSTFPMFLVSKPIIPHISVMGLVYCDAACTSFNNNHTYLLPGADVRVDCKFKAVAPRTAEEITFSANRTTNRFGLYRLDIPSVDGVYCGPGGAVLNMCRATLIRSSSPACDVPGLTATVDEFSIKYKHANVCVYSMFSLSFRPSKKDPTICGK